MKSLKLKNIGQIKKVDVKFGDLTIVVGNQATGKSTFLQLQKLIQDMGYIKNELSYHGFSYDSFENFLALYLGDGMQNIWQKNSEIFSDYKKIDLEDRISKSRATQAKNFYIPAQRVMMMEQGFAKPFTSFDISYPFVLKEFSEKIRFELDKIFLSKQDVFPQPNKLKYEFKKIINKHIFRNSKIQIKSIGSKKQLIMNINGKDFSVGSWSAGQKEFAPLLFGFYWAMPPWGVAKRDKITTIIIEEPEMGLHPTAIVDSMILIFELLARGYKVTLSTHSSTILELFWAINNIIKNKKRIDVVDKFIELFSLPNTKETREFISKIKDKKFKIYYFKSDTNNKTTSVDISDLNNLDNEDISSFGGITSFSDHISDIVSKIYEEI